MTTNGTVAIGRYVGLPEESGAGLRFLCDAPELERHVEKPWFRAYAAERLDIPPGAMVGNNAPTGAATVGHDLLARHTAVLGATGSGKTRLALHLLAEQIKDGCSVVMLDPKIETIRHMMALAYSAGMAPEQVTVLSPHLSGAGAPGWNPLDARASGIAPAQAATDVVSVLERSTSSWGPRMGDLLTNALIVVSTHGLSLFELARLLQRDDYRERLLRLPLPHAGDTPNNAFDSIAFEEARDFFLSEFAAWSKSERAAAVAPVLNKFRELLRTPFLRALLCARRTTLHLGALWHRPGLVLAHLDAAALGDEGVRMLGGLLAHQLLRTAMRADGPVPVVLALDEMGVSEEFVGGAAAKILAIARSRGLRLLVACQHLAQLSEGLRSALLANTAVRAYFRLGYADARLVAASLAAGTGERVSRIAADVAKRDKYGLPEGWGETAHTVRDGRGEPIKFSAAAEQAFWHLAHKAGGPSQIDGLKRLARVSGIDRLYVHTADTKEPAELSRYLRGLAPDDYRLSGSGPVRLVVRFPRPRLSVLSKETETERERYWIKTLGELPVRHAVVRLASGKTGTVAVLPVSDPGGAAGFDKSAFERFLSAAVAGSGQSAREVEQAQAWRRAEIERIAEERDRIAGGQEAEEKGFGERHADTPSRTAPLRQGRRASPKPTPSKPTSPKATVPKGASHGRAATGLVASGLTESRPPASKHRQSEKEGHPPPPAIDRAGLYGTIVAEDGSLA